MRLEGEPGRGGPENLDPNLLLREVEIYGMAASLAFLPALASGLVLLAGRETLDPWMQATLGGIFLINTALGSAFLIQVTKKGIQYLESFPEEELPLSQALKILEHPASEEVAPVMRAIIQGGNLPALGPAAPSLLLPKPPGEGEAIALGDDHSVGSLTVRQEDEPKAALVNLSAEQMEEVAERRAAFLRVVDEIIPGGKRREALFGDVKRGWILDSLIYLLTMVDLLARLPEVVPLIRAFLVAALKEGSPEVLEKAAELLKTLFSQLIKGESLRNERIRVSALKDPRYTQLQTLATIRGLTIPAPLEEQYLREERKKDSFIDTASLIETGPFKPEEWEFLFWVLAALNLRSMPEVRERIETMITQLISFWRKTPLETIKRLLQVEEGKNPLQTRENLTKAQARILQILEFAQKVPSLGLGPSIQQLAQSLGLKRASIEFSSTETLGLYPDSGVTAVVTLPPGKELSLDDYALILTRAAVEQPLSPFLAISRGKLERVSPFESVRTAPPIKEEIEMLFAGEEVLDWLLNGRNPAALPEMNLIRQEPTELQKLEEMGEDLPVLVFTQE